MLNLTIGFLTPQDETDLLPEADDDGELLTNEFKPFRRKLPEFKFWHKAIGACWTCFFCTFFSFLSIPVFWPILLVYAIILFGITMKDRIKHMIKFKYIPFDFGKKKTYSSPHILTKKKVPAKQAAAPLPHMRHTIRTLPQQHRPPPTRMTTSVPKKIEQEKHWLTRLDKN